MTHVLFSANSQPRDDVASAIGKYLIEHNLPGHIVTEIHRRKALLSLLRADLARVLRIYNVPYETPNWRTIKEAKIALAELSALEPVSEISKSLGDPDFVVAAVQRIERSIHHTEYTDKYMKLFGNDAVCEERSRRKVLSSLLRADLSRELRFSNMPYQTPNWRTIKEAEIVLAELAAQAPTSEILLALNDAPDWVVTEVRRREQAEKSVEQAAQPSRARARSC